MRWLLGGLVLGGAIGCNNVDRPPVIGECDPETMKCGPGAVQGGGVIGGGTGGSGGSSGSGSGIGSGDWTGSIVELADDRFSRGMHYSGLGVVIYDLTETFRSNADYDGDLFVIEELEEANPNWFMAVPEDEDLMPTIQPVDTSGGPFHIDLGVPPWALVEELIVLTDNMRVVGTSHLVLRVVDESGSTVAGVQAPFEYAAYRRGSAWIVEEGASTDLSGLIFLPNQPGGDREAFENITLTGSIEAEVSVMTFQNTLTLADVPFY